MLYHLIPSIVTFLTLTNRPLVPLKREIVRNLKDPLDSEPGIKSVWFDNICDRNRMKTCNIGRFFTVKRLRSLVILICNLKKNTTLKSSVSERQPPTIHLPPDRCVICVTRRVCWPRNRTRSGSCTRWTSRPSGGAGSRGCWPLWRSDARPSPPARPSPNNPWTCTGCIC